MARRLEEEEEEGEEGKEDGEEEGGGAAHLLLPHAPGGGEVATHPHASNAGGTARGRSAAGIFARVVAACTYIFLLEGTAFGFAALRPLYVQASVFAAACGDPLPPGAPPPATGQPACDAQAARLAALLTTGAAVGDLVALPIGLVVWVFGRRAAFITAGVVMAAGFAALGLGAHYAAALSLPAQAAAMHGGFVVISFGHSLLFSGTLLYAADLKHLPDRRAGALHPYATGMIAGSYALATLTPVALAALRLSAAGVYAVFAATAATLVVFAMVAEGGAAGGGRGATRGAAVGGGWPAARAALLDACARWRYALRPTVWVVWLWVSLSTVTMNWYQATVADQVAWFAGPDTAAADTLTTAFNILLPLGGAVGNIVFTLALPTPAASAASLARRLRSHSHSAAAADPAGDGAGAGVLPPPSRTAWRGVALALGGVVAWGIPALIPVPWLQLLPMTVFSAWRTGIFVTFYHHINEAFEPAALLLLINGDSLLTGVLAFINDPLRTAVTEHGNPLFSWITGIYVGIITLLAAAALLVVKPAAGQRAKLAAAAPPA